MKGEFKGFGNYKAYVHGNIFMYKGDPVCVYVPNSVEMSAMVSSWDWTLEGRYIGKIKPNVAFDFNDDAFQQFPFELGYINIQGSAWFLARNGVRSSNYGLSIRFIKGVNIHGSIHPLHHICNTDKLLYGNSSLHKCLTNDYPTFETCLKAIKNGTRDSAAFHKYYAIGTGINDKIQIFNGVDSKPLATLEGDKFRTIEDTTGQFSVLRKNNIIKKEYFHD